MPTFRLIAALILSLLLLGCQDSTPERKPERSESTTQILDAFSALETRIKGLESENLDLRRHQEMAIGEVAFAQGCRLWINTCFDRDEVGRQLIETGLTAQGTYQFFFWMASKIMFLCLALSSLAGTTLVILNKWIKPSNASLLAAQEIIDHAGRVHAEIDLAKASAHTEIKRAVATAADQENIGKRRLEEIRRSILLYESEAESLKAEIQRLEGDISALEIAKAAEAAFTKTRR